jgi:hypothetical protein
MYRLCGSVSELSTSVEVGFRPACPEHANIACFVSVFLAISSSQTVFNVFVLHNVLPAIVLGNKGESPGPGLQQHVFSAASELLSAPE